MNQKILIINSSSPIDLVGGTQSSLKYIHQNLNKKYDISYISWSFSDEKYGFYEEDNFKGLRLPDIRKRTLIFFQYLITKFNKIKKTFNVDIIWVHSPLPWFFLTFFLNKNIKLIYTIHGPLKREIKYSKSKFKFLKLFFSNFILNHCVKKANLIHYNSNYVYSKSTDESDFLLTKKKIILELLVDSYIFKNTIDNLDKNLIDDPYKLYNQKYFLICRRLVQRTGVIEFINLINNDKMFEKFPFVITGDGPLKKDIARISKNNIRYLGEVSETNLNYLKKNAFCYVIPSLAAEGYCLLAKEARILNKRVIHTNQGGLKESLKNYNGSKIFNIKDLNSLKKVFNELILEDKKINNNENFIENNFYKKLSILFSSV